MCIIAGVLAGARWKCAAVLPPLFHSGPHSGQLNFLAQFYPHVQFAVFSVENWGSFPAPLVLPRVKQGQIPVAGLPEVNKEIRAPCPSGSCAPCWGSALRLLLEALLPQIGLKGHFASCASSHRVCAGMLEFPVLHVSWREASVPPTLGWHLLGELHGVRSQSMRWLWSERGSWTEKTSLSQLWLQSAGADACVEVGGYCPVGFHLHTAWHTHSHRRRSQPSCLLRGRWELSSSLKT